MRRGFTLLEVLIALSILFIGLLAILALVPQVLEAGGEAERQAVASVLLSNVDESLALGFSRALPAAPLEARRVPFLLEDDLDTLTLPDSGARLFPGGDDDLDDVPVAGLPPPATIAQGVYPARAAAAASVPESSDPLALYSFDVSIAPAADPAPDAGGAPRAYLATVRVYRAFRVGEANEPVAKGAFFYEYPR